MFQRGVVRGRELCCQLEGSGFSTSCLHVLTCVLAAQLAVCCQEVTVGPLLAGSPCRGAGSTALHLGVGLTDCTHLHIGTAHSREHQHSTAGHQHARWGAQQKQHYHPNCSTTRHSTACGVPIHATPLTLTCVLTAVVVGMEVMPLSLHFGTCSSRTTNRKVGCDMNGCLGG